MNGGWIGRMLGRPATSALLIAAMAAGAMPGAAAAQSVQTQPVIAANRLAVPPMGRLQARKRLMDSSLPKAPAAAPSAAGASGRNPGPGAFRWFWAEVSAARSAANPQRWTQVITAVERARATGKPVFGSPASARRIVDAYGALLEREARRLDLSLPLLIAVVEVESGGNSAARSPKGAGGLMQLMPETAARFGVADAYAPAQNIRGGAAYLNWLLDRFSNDAVLALAGYNAGEGAVDKHAGVPPFTETRDYIAKVAGAYAAARALCATPPANVRDTCRLK